MLSVIPFFRSFVVATSGLSWMRSLIRPRGYSASNSLVVVVNRPPGPGDPEVPSPPVTMTSSIRTPPLPGRYTPGSMVTGTRSASLPVLEVLGVAGVADQVPGRGVDLGQRGARPGRGQPRLLGLRHQVVGVPLPLRGLADADGPGHVRVIAAVPRAEVDRDQVPAAQRPVAGHVMRDRAVRAAGHDRVERGAFGAEIHHPALERGGQLPLGDARPDRRQQLLEGLAADPARGGQQVELRVILDRA